MSNFSKWRSARTSDTIKQKQDNENVVMKSTTVALTIAAAAEAQLNCGLLIFWLKFSYAFE